MDKTRILITGASGFIGRNLLENLIKEGYEVANVDSKPPGDEAYSAYWKKIDITDYRKFCQVVTDFRPDYMVHLAARTDLDGKNIQDYPANTEGVENLMRIAGELPDLKKVIIASSMLVCRAGYIPLDQFDYAPTTFYGQSKVETEKIVWANRPQCDWAIIRPTSIWGPGFGVPYRNFFDMIIAHRYFHIGRKGCTKTYGYVGNAVYQIKQILFSDTRQEDQKVFYIGDLPATDIEIWANEIAAQLGYRIRRMPYFMIKAAALFGDVLKRGGIHFPMTSFRLKNMTTDNMVDLSSTCKLAPQPPFSREEGIRHTLKWMEEVSR